MRSATFTESSLPTGADRRRARWNHVGDLNPIFLDPGPRTLLGLAASVGMGALIGVAGGELLMPTIVLLFAVDNQDRRQPRFRPRRADPVLVALPLASSIKVCRHN
jgi:hypothetical protein